MNFIENLFGTIAGANLSLAQSNIGFIPLNDEGKILNIVGESAIWLGLKNKLMQMYAYEYCYPVASVTDRLAEMDTTGCVEILRTIGKGKDNLATNDWSQRMRNLFKQPNPLQTWEQFRGQQVMYKRVFGYCPVLPFVPAGFSPDYAISMINLPPWLFTARGTGNLLYTSSKEEVIKEYSLTILDKVFTLRPDQVIILEDSFAMDPMSSFLLPQSKLVGLDMAVSNICAAMEADNVLLKKKGPLGFISHDAAAVKDSVAGYLPMTAKEKDELQNNLMQYGMSLRQFQYVISRQAVKWNPMSFDVKQLGTKDTVVAGEKAICHRYGYPYVLYEQQDATYANGLNAEKGVYQSNIIPNNTKDLNKYNKFFLAEENQCKIVCDYSHIAAFQEDALSSSQADRFQAMALQIEYDENIITKNQWLAARGYDTVADGDKYKKDEVQQTADPVEDPQQDPELN